MGWKATSGIYAIETGTPDVLGMCNIHIHAIVDSEYMNQAWLASQWRSITGDSYIVDIRKCFSHYGAIRYLTDYITKVPSDSPKWFKDRFNDTFHGTRLIQSFGLPSALPLAVPSSACRSCGAVGTMVCVDFDNSLDGFSPRGVPIQIAEALHRWAS